MIQKMITTLSLIFSSLINSADASDDNEGSGALTKAHIYYCSDGDTCRAKIADGSMWLNVRLFGIDAPETAKKRGRKAGQPMGDEAKDFLNTTIKGKDVMLVQADLDIYNRPIVEITLGEQNVNLTMIERGLAEVYRGKTKRLDRKKYEDAELKAQTSKMGIWAQKDYMSPGLYRRKQQ